MMHRLGIVPQRLLREPLRVAALSKPAPPTHTDMNAINSSIGVRAD
jgi:hypothetical protein